MAAMADFGEIIKTKRMARKWSLRQLGDEIGVTAAYVADIEAGRRRPSPEPEEASFLSIGDSVRRTC